MSEDCGLNKLRELLREMNAPRRPPPSIEHLPLVLALEAMTGPDPFAALGALEAADAAVTKAKAGKGAN